MKPRRPRLRLVTTLALTLGLGLAGAACDKGGDSTEKPGERKNGPKAEGGDGAAKLDGGKEYVYPAEGFSLTATTTIKFGLASKQGSGEAEVSARSMIEATPIDGGKLKVHGKVIELIGYKGTGQLDPEFMKKQAAEQGQTDFDLLAELAKSEGWTVIDQKGELDKAATEALAENKTEEDGSVDFGLFNLPDLPRIDLVEGEKIKVPTQAVDRQTLVGMVPVEVDETWTLRKIENRVAEIDVSSEASGATEITGNGGSANVSIFEESSYTLFFNLDTKLPVAISGYSQSEMQLDIEGQSETLTIEQNSEVNGTYDQGLATGPAADAPAAAGGAPAAGGQ
ncbi:MAG TPA: hypothetical protein VM869_10560 [Enhygromyxa sp.]|nr:hypothetical protein [Enhygromyxa sp.]